jgi:peptidoglycan hydrolase-like protein with peptidoglycan-binding domain
MNEFKYQISQLILVVILALGAYWAFTRLDNGISYTREQVVDTTVENTEEPVAQNEELPEGAVVQENPEVAQPNTLEGTTPDTQAPSAGLDKGALAKKLEAVLALNTIYASGVQNDNIKSVQEFLAFYFPEKGITPDGAFGPGTKQIVLDFQNKELGGGDGRIGPNTLKKMIEILKK